MDKNSYCVIMAGGQGTRLWPMSRKAFPKQFQDPLGCGKTLLQQTFERYSHIVPSENIIISTNVSYKSIVKKQLPDIKEQQVVCEPVFRGTAPSIANLACHIRQLNPKANIVVAQSDQLVLDEAKFAELISGGLSFVAENNKLVVIGIKPTCPETRYGYIQAEGIPAGESIYKVRTFTEKPALEFAKVFVESGEFFWNTGLFVWNVNTIIHTMGEMLPEMNESFEQIFAKESNRDKRRAALYDCYESFPNISVDYAVIERASNVYMQIGAFGWADVGRWDDVYRYSAKDSDGNVVQSGHAELYNCHNNLISASDKKLVILQDLEGYLVNDTENVLVICKKDEDDDFKKFRTNVLIKYGEDYM